eukprot:2710937-Heterocapsa_arctica.AAC.1
MKPGKSVDSAAAPSGDSTKNGDRQMCRNFQESGKCRFGATCSFSHDAPPNTKSDKKPEKGATKEKDDNNSSGKKEDGANRKKGRPGAVAEVASSSEASRREDSSDDELSSESDSSD